MHPVDRAWKKYIKNPTKANKYIYKNLLKMHLRPEKIKLNKLKKELNYQEKELKKTRKEINKLATTSRRAKHRSAR